MKDVGGNHSWLKECFQGLQHRVVHCDRPKHKDEATTRFPPRHCCGCKFNGLCLLDSLALAHPQRLSLLDAHLWFQCGGGSWVMHSKAINIHGISWPWMVLTLIAALNSSAPQSSMPVVLMPLMCEMHAQSVTSILAHPSIGTQLRSLCGGYLSGSHAQISCSSCIGQRNQPITQCSAAWRGSLLEACIVIPQLQVAQLLKAQSRHWGHQPKTLG